MIERAAAAHRAELDSLFVGDQHVSRTPYYQNRPMLGGLLAEWGDAPACSCFPCGIRYWWRSRSGRWPPSLEAPSLCNAGSVPPWFSWWVGSAKTPYQAGFAALHSSADRLK
jgi:hypothetical protein